MLNNYLFSYLTKLTEPAAEILKILNDKAEVFSLATLITHFETLKRHCI